MVRHPSGTPSGTAVSATRRCPGRLYKAEVVGSSPSSSILDCRNDNVRLGQAGVRIGSGYAIDRLIVLTLLSAAVPRRAARAPGCDT